MAAGHTPCYKGSSLILFCSTLAFPVLLALDVWELGVLLIAGIIYALLTHRLFSQKLSCKNKCVKNGNHKTSCTLDDIIFVQPETAPTVKRNTWDDEAQECFESLSPAPTVHTGVNKLVDYLQQIVSRLFHGGQVHGFVRGNSLAVKAYRSAMPDIQITITVDLADHFSSALQGAVDESSSGKLNKHILRTAMKQLVNKHGFKFRRAPLQNQCSSAVLAVPQNLQFFREAVCIEISVNSMEPAHAAEVLDFGVEVTPLANQLVMLVQQWARDRGITNAAEGGLSQYAWSVLALFFMQASGDEGVPLLPPFRKSTQQDRAACCNRQSASSIGGLLEGFFRFYAEEYDLRTETVCISTGQRCKRTLPLLAKDLRLGKHGVVEVAPCIRDPFNAANDLGSAMSAHGIVQLKAEFTRASILCCQGAPLAEVFALWCQPNVSGKEERQDLGDQ